MKVCALRLCLDRHPIPVCENNQHTEVAPQLVPLMCRGSGMVLRAAHLESVVAVDARDGVEVHDAQRALVNFVLERLRRRRAICPESQLSTSHT
jgi:hypothetical protein